MEDTFVNALGVVVAIATLVAIGAVLSLALIRCINDAKRRGKSPILVCVAVVLVFPFCVAVVLFFPGGAVVWLLLWLAGLLFRRAFTWPRWAARPA